MEKVEKNKAPRVPLSWLTTQLETLKFSYYDLARIYAHDKEQANSAISILNRYFNAVESYFQWMSWDKGLVVNTIKNYLKDKNGVYAIGDIPAREPEYQVPNTVQELILEAIDAKDYYRMSLGNKNYQDSELGYADVASALWGGVEKIPDYIMVNRVALAVINTIRGKGLDPESYKSAEPTEAIDVLNATNTIEEKNNRLSDKEFGLSN